MFPRQKRSISKTLQMSKIRLGSIWYISNLPPSSC